jgi:hypothetical protein
VGVIKDGEFNGNCECYDLSEKTKYVGEMKSN